MSELRWHPFLQEWVITATHRQDRTFLPEKEACPFCPNPNDPSAEVPVAAYEIAVIENRFPSLSLPPPAPAVGGTDDIPVRPSEGKCEVVLYTPDHDATFSDLDERHIRKLIEVWLDRYADLSSQKEVRYVYIFENKGKEIGVTLTHPHGQIYAYPFVPALVQRRLDAQRSDPHRFQRWLDWELSEAKRIVHANAHWVLLVPFFARYPYELHVVPRRRANDLRALSDEEKAALASALKIAARTLDNLFGFSMPYILSLFQYWESWAALSFEFTPPYRTATKLKYLAGSEAGCGVFINDALPEDTAQTLRERLAT
jgi:UDPglucose--hexose-1-phosphate uridylyltransferase